jgi:hypothetical protein
MGAWPIHYSSNYLLPTYERQIRLERWYTCVWPTCNLLLESLTPGSCSSHFSYSYYCCSALEYLGFSMKSGTNVGVCMLFSSSHIDLNVWERALSCQSLNQNSLKHHQPYNQHDVFLWDGMVATDFSFNY